MTPEEQALDTAKGFLQKVLYPPLEELGLTLTDQLRFWRAKKQIDLALKAESYVKMKGVKTKKISLKVLTPLIESASLEEDELLQDKWAALLANTVTEGKDYENTIFSHILSQMTKQDAEIFQLIYQSSVTINRKEGPNFYIEIRGVQNISIDRVGLNKIYKGANISIDNLLRLRLVKELTPGDKEPILVITELGITFMDAISIT